MIRKGEVFIFNSAVDCVVWRLALKSLGYEEGVDFLTRWDDVAACYVVKIL